MSSLNDLIQDQNPVIVEVFDIPGPPTSGFSGYSGRSGYSGYSGSGKSGYSGFSGPGGGQSGFSGYSGTGSSGLSGYSGFSGSGYSGYSGYSSSGLSGYSGFSGSGLSGYSGYSGSGLSGYSGFSGAGLSGFSGYSGSGISGYSGYSGSGLSGYSGYSGSGLSGYSGFSSPGTSGFSGYSGFCGLSGYSGFCGLSGYSGFSGLSGYSGFCGTGTSGYSGFCGLSGYSGFSSPGTSGFSGYSGYCGLSGYSGYCGLSGYSGFCGLSGYSGYSGTGLSGFSGYSGFCGLSGYSGYCGLSGYSGFCGLSGYSGFSAASPGASGYSGYSGYCGLSGYSGYSGYSGFCGLSGYSGYSGYSAYSGYSGPSLLPLTTQTVNYSLVLADANTMVSMDSASALTLTVPTNASQAFTIGTQIVIRQGSTGGVTIAAAGGVTLNATSLIMSIRWSEVVLIKTATDTWFVATGSPGLPKVLATYSNQMEEIVGTVVSKAGTITGTAGVGSSLFLQRILIPAVMNLTEIDIAMSIGFAATSQGAGTMSRSMALYSFGNSTSLATVASVSGTSAWTTGTSTAGASSSLTQFQGGWSTPLIQPMTFGSTSISPGEYVIGQIFDFAQGSSTWTINFYGAQVASTFLASAATNLTSATLGALSSGGLAAGSAITGLTQAATNNVSWAISRASSAVTSVASATSSFTFIEHAFVSSIGTLAGSIIGTSGSLSAVTNVALGALNSSTLAQLALPNIGFIGTGSTTSNFPTVFINGIMSTGAIPTAITLTSTAVTYSGSVAFQQPWFMLAGT